mmetsp:Transcript_15576/g.35476  ORF Transcript_15576/g.35476 Transcript_15576/m.35476 type:complete len:194 (+) Transcript_15576:62-643(+)
MARVGSVDYTAFYHSPPQRAQYWREVINRETWNHTFHPLNERLPVPHYKDLISASKEGQSQPWRLLKQSFHVGRDDFGTSYLDGRQQPTGMPKNDRTRPENVLMTSLPAGQVPSDTARLTNNVRTRRTAGALQMSATIASMRGATDFGRSDKRPTVRAPACSNERPGWGSSSMPALRPGDVSRPPSFARILNV